MTMASINWKDIVFQSRQGNERVFNKAVLEQYESHFKWSLVKVTEDKELAWDVYMNAMTKFWERFIIKKEDLPKSNIRGYIYNMARNNFLDLKRKENKKSAIRFVELDYQSLFQKIDAPTVENSFENELDLNETQNQEHEYLSKLVRAINQLCEDCRKLIEKNIFQKIKLKTLKEELGYKGTYQTIVEKKKRCIRKLTKLFFTELA